MDSAYPFGSTFSQAAYKSLLLHQNWQLLTPTMALNLTITISNLKCFILIMCFLNEKLNVFWFLCKTENLYNISVIVKYNFWYCTAPVAQWSSSQLKDKSVDICKFWPNLTIYRSCTSIVWYSLFLCAIDLHCYLKTIKNTSVRHFFLLRRTL